MTNAYKNLIDKIDKSHERVGECLKQGLKKTPYTSLRIVGGLAVSAGIAGVALTAGTDYLKHKTADVSGLQLFLGKIFYTFLPKNQKLGISLHEVLKD